MKKSIIVFMTTFLMFFATSKAQVIFDPATIDTSTLPDGIEVVDVNGVHYLQILLNEWNTSFPVDPVRIEEGNTHVISKAKYAVGSSGYALSEVNTFLKLVTSGWDEIGAAGAASDSMLTKYLVGVNTVDTVASVQVAGQETQTWSAVAGDTLWLGKMWAVSYDPTAIFDPETTFPEDLPEGMNIVDMNGTKYLKVALNAWNSFINIDPYELADNVTHFSCMAKYEVGTSGYDISEINTFLKLSDPDWTELGSAGNASSADFTEYQVELTGGETVGVFQMAGQETQTWNAVAGDTMYIGKVNALVITVDSVAKFTESSPKIDGEIDEMWTNMGSVSCDSVSLGEFDSEDDHQLSFKTAWDHTNFYLLAEVVDDSLYNGHENDYQRDNVEIFFDMDNAKTALDPPGAPWPATAYDDNDYQLRFIWGEDNKNVLNGRAISAQVNTEEGWVLEVQIPWSALMADFVPGNDVVIGFDVGGGDNDGVDREGIHTWHSWADEGWHDPSYFGNLVLEGPEAATKITSFEDDFESETIWDGWDVDARSHTLSQGDGMLTISVDKPSDAEKWDGLTMGFGENTLLDLSQNGGYFSVDLKSEEDCKVDIALWAADGEYNPGNNTINLTGGEDWVTMTYQFSGGNLIHYKWNGDTLGYVDAATVHHLLMTFNGGSAWTGTVHMDNMKIGDAAVPEPAMVTFIVDDSQGQTHEGFALKGSWDLETGTYDDAWSEGVELAQFHDDGTHGDETADDHIFTVTVPLIPDGGENTWEWGVNDADGNWLDGNFEFTVPNSDPQTLDAYVIATNINKTGTEILSIYPNPVSTILNLNNSNIQTVEIYSVHGVKVLSGNLNGKNTLDVSTLAAGVYLIKAMNIEGEVAISKFSKE